MIDNLEKLIKSDKYPPIILLFGEEELLIEEAFDKLIASLCKTPESRYDLEILDGENVNIIAVLDSSSAYPFMAERRVVGVKNFEKLFEKKLTKKEVDKSPFANYINDPQLQTVLIIVSADSSLNGITATIKNPKDPAQAEKKLKGLKFPYNIILEKYAWIEFPRIYESHYTDWVLKRFKSRGKDINQEACALLVAQTNPTLRDLNNEIDKILLFIRDKKEITKADINFMTSSSKVNNIFELQKSIGNRNLSEALIIIENMLSAESQEMLILTMLLRYFIVLWKLIEESALTSNNYQLAAKVGINAYFLNDYLSALKNYTPKEIDKAFIFLAETEEKLKSSSTDKLYLMQNMLIRIMGKNK